MQDKKVVVCDPDILTFSVVDHSMHYAVLATDGLWDTHTNEDAVAALAGRLDQIVELANFLAYLHLHSLKSIKKTLLITKRHLLRMLAG